MKQEYHPLDSILCFRSLGYHYNESGEVEKQDMFLSRMSGIMQLYAAVLISQPCRYQQNKSHPHGLAQAWRWIACMLNMGKFPQYNTHAEIN
jgi:nucleoporin GLE1